MIAESKTIAVIANTLLDKGYYTALAMAAAFKHSQNVITLVDAIIYNQEIPGIFPVCSYTAAVLRRK